ncbi:DNA cytosine methyltransferase [Janthinobacterium sp. SUN137]|uniref:DNA cytosine methyltransferase n=1 Tax=Janthinobacterium sp. SUN137 TaxID=3014789 RepID=UPI0027125002|nr:DNA cytosine methyltransferase [Janthinobacterium sp. SUN137]MDO8041304.1 DNA cytosine methyltransferase [Janthinobacterium sp. SUN137]
MPGSNWTTSGPACFEPYRWARCSLQALPRRVRNSQSEAIPVSAFYNEIDPYAAAWLRNLIEAGHIAPGIVDERSIEDICPDELVGYTQCHFFAGVGVWSYALRRAGWDDTRPVWTGSCPCQPFSSAGKGTGFDDQRHLWPAFQHLIKECSPAIVLGEQVASKDADSWLDLVQTDLEGLGYAFGAVAFPSAGVGAPHIRDRTYWVANTNRSRPQSLRRKAHKRISPCKSRLAQGGAIVWMANAYPHGCNSKPVPAFHDVEHHAEPCRDVRGLAHPDNSRQQRRRPGEASNGRNTPRIELERFCDAGVLANAEGKRLQGRQREDGESHCGSFVQGGLHHVRTSEDDRPGPTNGYWRDADWLGCSDGKWRPVEPGTFPLAHGATSRVGRLRAYGNAINAEQARIFIESVMETP